jgi:putative ABC transport system permease protein
VVGARLLAKYGWRVGQRVTLTSNVFPDLEVTVAIVGTYDRGPDEETFLLQRRYLQELLRATPYFGTVGSFVVVVQDERDLPRVIQEIDARFESSEAPTKTETEKEFLLNALNVVGDVRVVIRGVTWIALVVVFFIVTNAMAGSVRERASEIAVLKTLGFAPRTVAALVAGECLLVAALGGAVASLGTRVLFHDVLGRPTVLRYFPEFAPPWTTVVTGLGLSLVLGAVAGIWPAVLASRVTPAQGLRRV